MTEIPENTKEEESQSPAANQNSSDKDEYHEYRLRQLYDGMNPIDGPVDVKLKKLQVVCKECGLVADHIQEEGSSLQDCRAAHRHASLPYTSTVPSSDFSMHQLRRLFELVRSPADDMLEDKKHMKRFQVVCKLCNLVADLIEEGSSLHDSHVAHRHASLHRDEFEDTSLMDEFFQTEDADQPDYSEAELLRIYLADSYTWPDYIRPWEPPRMKPAVVTYFVVCKVCKLLVYTKDDQTSCLHENSGLQEHALMHSEYLLVY